MSIYVSEDKKRDVPAGIFLRVLQPQGCGKIKFQGGKHSYDYQSQPFCIKRTSSTWH